MKLKIIFTIIAVLAIFAGVYYFSPQSPADKATIQCNKEGGLIYFLHAGQCVQGSEKKDCYVLTCEFPVAQATATSTATTTP